MDWIIVGTARQLLGAAEWVAQTGRSRRRVVLTVLVPSEHRTAAQLRAVLADDPWPEVEVVDLARSGARWSLLRRAGARAGRIGTIVVGEYRLTLTREAIRRAAPDQVVLVDDGNATVIVAHHRRLREHTGVGLNSLRLNGSLESGRRRVHRVMGLTAPEPSELVLGTLYDVTGGLRDAVLRQRFDHLRSRLALPPIGGAPVVLGASIAESGIVSAHHYELLVDRLVARIGAREYWPHRREDPQKVARIVDRHRLRLRQTVFPAERAVFDLAARPSAVGSVLSSSVDSMIALFDDITIATEPPAVEMLSSGSQHAVELVLSASARLAAEATARGSYRSA